MNDLAKTIEPKSDQQNADDFLSGPRTVKITAIKVDASANQQPVSVSFEGDNNKPYKPCKSMIRAMVKVWKSNDSQSFVGKSMTLYLDPEVTWGGMAVGGIRISHMSHITREVKMAMTASKTKRTMITIKPLVVEDSGVDDASAAAKSKARSMAKGGSDTFNKWWNTDEGKQSRPLVEDIMDELKTTVTAFTPEGDDLPL